MIPRRKPKARSEAPTDRRDWAGRLRVLTLAEVSAMVGEGRALAAILNAGGVRSVCAKCGCSVLLVKLGTESFVLSPVLTKTGWGAAAVPVHRCLPAEDATGKGGEHA